MKLSKMSTAELMRALAAHLKTRIEEYLEKKQRFDEELSRDLDELSVTYGPDLVKTMLAQGEAAARRSRTSKTSRKGTAQNNAGPKSAKRSGSDVVSKKGIGIAALTPLVTEAIQQFKGKRFARKDVDALLSAKSIEFDTSHVSFILRRMDELEVVDRQKSDVGGPPLNVYQFKAHPSAKG